MNYSTVNLEIAARAIKKINPENQLIYISGPITGLPNLNKDQFSYYEEIIKTMNFQSINPFNLVSEIDQQTKNWEDFMRVDIKAMMDAGIILMLPGWEKSVGASCELFIAKILKIPVISNDFNVLLLKAGVLDVIYNKLSEKIYNHEVDLITSVLKNYFNS
jgi:hypothetical protein